MRYEGLGAARSGCAARSTALDEPMAHESLRLFTALWPSPAVRAALAARRDAIGWPPGAAPIGDGQLHLTLHFIGAFPAARLAELVDALQVPVRPFALRLGPALAWPHGLVVLQPHVVPDALLELHAQGAAALSRLGVTLEPRPYRPHVTLARRAAGARLPDEAPPRAWRVGGHALVWSDGGRYRVLARYTRAGVRLATARQVATARTPPAPPPTQG
jgi:2'-5' RNA ligase